MSKALSTALIDYLTYTNRKPDATPITVIKDDLRLNPDMFVQLSYSPLPHYNRSLKLGDMYVSYEPIKVVQDVSTAADDVLSDYGIDFDDDISQRQGICVSMSGNGCRQFEQYSKRGGGKMSPMADLLHYLYEQGSDAIHVTRVDLAIDDKCGMLDMDTVVVSSRSVMEISRAVALCISVLRRLCLECVSMLGELAAEVINGHMRFVDWDDGNITRCTVCQWWLDFLDNITESLCLVTADPAPYTIERKYSYLLWQMSPTIAAVYDTMGMAAFRRWLEYGASHMSKQLRACRDDYLATKQARVSN